MNSIKPTLIRHESELAHEFGRLFAGDERLDDFAVIPDDHPQDARLNLDGHHHRFTIKYLLTPTVADIPDGTKQEASPTLLVVPRLTEIFLHACRQNQASVADLNGRLFLRAQNLLVNLPPLPGRKFRFDLEPRNAFVGKSGRIARALLADPHRPWRQADLLERTGATSGLVSRIVSYLIRQGLLAKIDARQFRVVDPLRLLDAWTAADDFSRRTTTHRYTTLSRDPHELARTIRNVLTHGGQHFAFTQWIAGWLRHPYVEPAVVSLYVPQLPPQAALDQIGLRPVSDAGRVWFHLPTDEGVFREIQHVGPLPLVSDAQIYVDLQRTGLRGPDQAKAMREWSGFCRP